MSDEHHPPLLPPTNRRMRIFRFLKYIIILLFILIALIAGTAFIIGYYYQDEVKNYIIKELNKQLNAEIIIDGKDIDLTILKNFPLAAVDFKNVKALDASTIKDKDTLFKAQEISLQFNIIDIFNKNYRIKKIKFSNVDLAIRIDKQGKDNYHFWKPSSDSGSVNFAIALEEIVLNQIRLIYKNDQLKQRANVVINKSTLSGKFSNEKYSLEILSDLFINSVKVDGLSFLRKKNAHVELAFDVDNTKKSYTVKEGKFNIENVWFNVTGNVVAINDPTVDIAIKGKNMDIQSLLSLIPNDYKKKINDYNCAGGGHFNASIKGYVSKGKTPQITADFGIDNANITQVTNNIILRNIHLKGNFSNGKTHTTQTCVLKITGFNAILNNGSIEGELMITDFSSPFIDSKIKADILLDELQHFVKFDTIERISGQLKLNMELNGKWDDIAAGSNDRTLMSGSLTVSDMDMKIKNYVLPFTKINGDFNFDNSTVIVNNCSGNIANSDFYLKGSFKNIINYLFKENHAIVVDASLNSKNMDLNQLLENKKENSSSDSQYNFKFSEHLDLNLNSTIDHLVFRKFEAKNIKGVVKLKNKKMMVDPIVFSTMDGNFSTSGIIDGSDSSKLFINCFSEIKNINVTKMFTAFENFGQNTITDKNIKGTVNATILFKTPISPSLDIDMDKLYANIDMTLDKGELMNVEPMKNLSRFIELDELMDVKFATLKNQFEIKNQTTSFPQMELNSNVLNLAVSGTHSFNNDINYKIKLTLSDLLSKKIRKKKPENNEFGEVANDGTGRTNIFLSMTGTVDKPIIKYDRKGAIQNFKQNLKTEKQTIKTMLKDELGLFKKDTSLNQKTKKEDNTKFNIEWDGNTNKKEEKKELKVPKKKSDDEDF